jgi:hypothetical protein
MWLIVAEVLHLDVEGQRQSSAHGDRLSAAGMPPN